MIMTLRADRRSGFTLVELMIVVAIIAVLAVVAIIGFSRWKRNAIRSEAAAVLGSISLRQEAYRAEFSSYINCPTGNQRWPNLGANEPVKKNVGPNTCWQSLGLTTDPALYCAYSIYSGAPGAFNTLPSADQVAFPGAAAPTALWYLGVAECDLDGVDDGVGKNTVFYRTHHGAGMGERNPGK